MKPPILRFTLFVMMIYLTCGALNPAVAASPPSGGNGTHFCGVTDSQSNKRFSDQFPGRRYARTSAANLDVGEPRTVRLIYFLPNDWSYRADSVQEMKDGIRAVQTFYAEQMEAHGYGKVTFRVETDSQGEPMVHPVDGQHPDRYYLDNRSSPVIDEIRQVFDLDANIYFILAGRHVVVDGHVFGGWSSKNGGYGVLNSEVFWPVLAHELGHAFGLAHDFRNNDYIMSYGEQNQLSTCAAEFLSVHPYFNPDTPIEEGPPPTIELISPRTYTADSKSIPVQLKVSDPDGIHHVFLHVIHPNIGTTVKACHGLTGEKDAIVQFDYDGIIPSAHRPSYSTSFFNPLIHPISVTAVDIFGNLSWADFTLFPETLQPLTKISGDNQRGLPNAPLPVPFAVDVRDVNDGSGRQGVWVTFTVTVGGGMFSAERVMTDFQGRAKSTLTLGPSMGTNTVEVSAEGITVTFNAVAENIPLSIPDPNLRAAIEKNLKKTPGTSITSAEMATLTKFSVYHASISNLTGLESATNLVLLALERNLISDISTVASLNYLTYLSLERNLISDISAVAGLNYLRFLNLGSNLISDISAVSGLTNLTSLNLEGNSISDISAVADLTNLAYLNLYDNNISNISAVVGLTNLTSLFLGFNSISDLSPLVANTGLGSRNEVDVRGNPLSYQSIHTHIPTLQSRGVTVKFDNRTPTLPLRISGDDQQGTSGEALSQPFVVEVRDQNGEAFAGVPVVFTVTEGGSTLSSTSTMTDANGRAQSTLTLGSNPGTNTVEVSVAGISQTAVFSAETTPPLPIPTTLEYISGDNQSGLTGEALSHPFVVEVQDENGDPLEGVTVTFVVGTGGGALSDTSVDTGADGLAQSTLTLGSDPGTNTVEVSVEGIAEMVTFTALAEIEFNLSVPAGISLIHVPLNVTSIDGAAKTIESIADLYDVLGGASKVTFLITYDSQAQEWRSYFGPSDTGTPADRALTDDTGIIAGMITPTSIRLRGGPLGTDGSSSITLNQGLNLVGLPLKDSRVNRVSDLFALDRIGGNVPVIILTDDGEFKAVGQADDPGDIAITGGQAFIMTAQRTETVTISGDGWYNSLGIAAAPPVGDADLHSPLTGLQVKDTTPVLALRGSIVDEEMGTNRTGFRVIVKNLSTGRAVAAVTKDENYSRSDKRKSGRVGYQVTVVDVETGRASTIGDNLEISVRSLDPSIGVEPLRYTVTAEDVKQSLIQLPTLVTYEIPAETQLLANYPNPFNPETWIPYRLAEDAFVRLTIYDGSGQIVRTLEVGHRITAVYEDRSKAVYWDGRNQVGEQVASGVYFYTLTAGDYSATRKMVILK